MFITFEGIEGSGKTTQIGLLIAWLEAKGYRCVPTREPGATKIGGKIRAILLDSNHADMLSTTELLLYEADRAQHVREVILPALESGKVVISDRFSDATTVYQGYARGLDLAFIETLHHVVLSGLKPDLSIVLDLPVEAGLERAWQRIAGQTTGPREDRFEKEDLAFHERVRQGYLTLKKLESKRFSVVDASRDVRTIHQDIIGLVANRLSGREIDHET